MMEFDQFQELVAEVAKLNSLSEDEAGDIVAEVGDTPEVNAAGNVIFQGRELRWPFDE
jgi:hypothetical protein